MKLTSKQQELLYKILDMAKESKCDAGEVFYQLYWYCREWEEKRNHNL